MEIEDETLDGILPRPRMHSTGHWYKRRVKNLAIEISIPPGYRAGTRFLCRNAGHEWKPNCFQNSITFIIEESRRSLGLSKWGKNEEQKNRVRRKKDRRCVVQY